MGRLLQVQKPKKRQETTGQLLVLLLGRARRMPLPVAVMKAAEAVHRQLAAWLCAPASAGTIADRTIADRTTADRTTAAGAQ